MSDLFGAMTISAHGMRAQGERIRVISENVANSDTAPTNPNEEAYRRKTITFKNVMDRENDMKLVEVDKISQDMKTEMPVKYLPDHPGADENGYVQMPNINTLIEIMDMKEAQRSYEANLGMMQQSRSMLSQTIDLLRSQ